MYSRKDQSPHYIEFSNNQKKMGDLFGFKNPNFFGSKLFTFDKIQFEPCFQLLKMNHLGQFEKSQQVYHSKKEGEAISAIRNTLIHDAKNFEIVYMKPKLAKHQLWSWLESTKESTKVSTLHICNRVNEIATYHMRRVCVTIKKYNVNKPPYIQIRLFTAKENETLKQVGYVNYILNEFKEMSFRREILGDFLSLNSKKFWENFNLLIIENLTYAL